MKLKNLLPILLTVFSLSLFAGNVSIDQAQKVAVNFYYEKYNQNEGQIDYSQIKITSIETESEKAQNFFYVFHFNKGGFVIVSAEEYLNPVLGFSFDNKYVSKNQPDHVNCWFGNYKDQITYIRENQLEAKQEIIEKWQYFLQDHFTSLKLNTKTRAVQPLLTTKWNQGSPYNSMCPVGEGGQAITGCVATAYAQCLYYWRFPVKGSGYYCYTHDFYGELCADFENTWYQWSAMSDSPRVNDTAVGELMSHVGIALDMDYSPTSSGTWMYPEQIEAHFNVSPDLQFLERDYYSDTEWKNIMMEQLDLGYPMPYVGFSNSGGHMWVCDGYQDDEFFHMNLGWGGSADGFYIINEIQGFNSGQQIGINLYPDTDNWEYPYYATGADTLSLLEGSITDGSGPVNDYLNNTTATWLIDPQTDYDSISSITIKIKRFDIYTDGDKLNIYNGVDNNAPLLASLSGNEIPEDITSSSNKVFIEFISDDENTAPGFYLNYECETAIFCNEMTQVTETSAIISEGSGDFYYSNSSFCIWIIDPGIDAPLTLHFNYFDTQEEYDILKIFDGDNNQLITTISGNYDTPPESVTSPSGKISMVFVSNSSIQGEGWETWYDISTDNKDIELNFDFQIIPNPISSDMKFNFKLNNKEQISIEIIDLLGNQQEIILQEELNSGYHSIQTNISYLPNGIYFCRTQIGNKTIIKKIVKVD